MEGRHDHQGGGRTGKIASPRLNLPQARAYKKFKIGELFDSASGDVDLQQKDLNSKGYFVVSSGVAANGIIGKTDRQAKVLPRNTITIDMFGNVFARDHEYKMVTHARVFSLLPKQSITWEALLYTSALMQNWVADYSYSNMASWKKIQDRTLELPVASPDSALPDFAFMEKYIRALEDERIRALDAYLKAAGFENAELTEEEECALSRFNEAKSALFKIGELFDVKTPPKRFNANAVKFGGDHPYVVRTSQNNGRRGCIVAEEKHLSKGRTISFGQDTATIFYQEKPYFTGDKIKVMKCKPCELGERNAMFFLTVMRRSFSNFKWGTSSFDEKILKNVSVSLPVTKSGEIDSALIDAFISAVMKKCISGVLEWKDREIATTKRIVCG